MLLMLPPHCHHKYRRYNVSPTLSQYVLLPTHPQLTPHITMVPAHIDTTTALWQTAKYKALQYGLRWLKSISQRWGPGSR